MKFQGYKISYNYTDWQQVEQIGNFWDFVAQLVPREAIVGLGWNWDAKTTSFDYALGTIDDAKILAELKTIDFSHSPFRAEYIEVELPPRSAWKTFYGRINDLQKIYEEEIDPLGEKDFELEYIDNSGNLKIEIHLATGEES